MQQALRYRLSLLLIVCCSLVSLYYFRSLSNTHIDAYPPLSFDLDGVPQSDYPAVPPKIQLIAIWSPGDQPPAYLPNFLASVAANPTVDLLFIKYDRYNHGKEECAQPRTSRIPNVREVCLSEDQVWTLHVDFFCERWSCDDQQRSRVLNIMVGRAQSDRVNSFYRPYRAAVFKRWIHPDTKLWGWCDLDMIFGNFDRAFPWDLSNQFDVYISGWNTGSDVLVFMPGHLTFFRYSQQVIDEFMLFPNLRNAESFLAEPWIDPASEESIYSYFLFVQSNLTFVRFDALISSEYHISSPGLGVYQVEDEWKFNRSDSSPLHIKDVVNSRTAINEVLNKHDLGSHEQPSFTLEGAEHVVELKVGKYTGPLWFPQNLSVHYDTDWSARFWEQGMRRFLYRRYPRGVVVERAEPGRPVVVPPLLTSGESNTDGPLLREQLYNHLQHEKYTGWWSLPDSPFKKGEILFIHKTEGAMLWDGMGRIRWRSTSWKDI